MVKNLCLLMCLLFCIACANDKFDAMLLPGEWKTTSWVEQKTDKKITNKMDFSFMEDGRYTIDYGSIKENGKYWVAGEFLHTVEDGQAEKKVKITSLTADHMNFEMNRTGSIELVSLKKSK